MKKLVLVLVVAIAATFLLCLTSCGEPKFEYKKSGDGYIIAGRGEVTDTDLVIPEKYRGKPIVGIANYAFENCTDITSVALPDTVTYIGMNSFRGCTGLKSINTPANLKKIGECAFEGCTSLEAFDLPDKLDLLVRNSFKNTKLLETEGNVIYVDGWVVSIENEPSSVTLREGTVGIAEYAFLTAEPHILTDVYLPSTLQGMEFYVEYSDIKFHYNGTAAEWRKIYKEQPYYLHSYTIICTDETIVYDGLN